MTEDVSIDSEERLESPEEVAELDELRMQLESFQVQAEERLDQLKRCRAELDNMMKRVAREREDYVNYASEKLICKLLPVLDSLDQASKHDEGIRVLYQQLFDILKAEGMTPIEAVGKKFDPYRHEALFQVKTEEMEDNTVAEEIQKGYLFNSRVIRFSKVAVAKR